MKENLTLLYVEDDEVVRNNYKIIFESYFQTVLTTDNGNDALKIYNENTIDIAIFDISIPGINGLNLASKVREIDEDIEIIIMSAYSDREKLFQAVSLKLFKYLIKPVSHADLKIVLVDFINRKSNKENMKLLNNYTWNNQNKTLFYKTEKIKLTENETKIIDILLLNKNSYLDACQIQSYLYNEDVTESDSCNGIVKIISRLRKKLHTRFENDNFFIESCYGIGYKIELFQ